MHGSKRWHPLPFLVIAATALLIVWTWAPRQQWNALDLQTLEWNLAFESRLSLATLSATLPVLLFGGAMLYSIARRRRERLSAVAPTVASWSAALIAFPLIAFTIGVLVTDAAKTDSWTLGQQNVAALRGNAGCGLADDVRVAVPSSAKKADSAEATLRGQPAGISPPPWVPPPPISGLPRFALDPTAEGVSSSAWIEIPSQPLSFFISGVRPETELDIRWGRSRGSGQITRLGRDQLSISSFLDEGTTVIPWRLVTSSELPPRAVGANRFSIQARSRVAPGSPLAVSAAVTHATEPLARRMNMKAPALVFPNVLTYFPCAVLPRLAGGIVEVPSVVMITRDSAWLLRDRGTSPFIGMLDLYGLRPLSVTEPRHATRSMEVYEVARDVPGAAVLPPVATTITS